MNMRRIIILLLAALVVIVGLHYTRVALRKASRPPEPARAPSLDDAPVRLYGLVEPMGREIFVGPLQPRRVVEVLVKEGDSVTRNDILCRLDDDLERQALRVAESRAAEAQRRRELTRDELRRKVMLAREKVVSDLEVTQLDLRAKLEEQQLKTAWEEIALRKAELENLVLRAPADGKVYKFDVRLGEQLLPADYGRIVLGNPQKQARLFVETFWIDQVKIGDRFRVRTAETLREMGTGVVVSVSPYVGTRDFRTEDRLERLDTKFAQAVLRIEGNVDEVPIGLQVVCERLPDGP
jgi:multidrug efflux pump subunit AcrA (membrane-fusion protein)